MFPKLHNPINIKKKKSYPRARCVKVESHGLVPLCETNKHFKEDKS